MSNIISLIVECVVFGDHFLIPHQPIDSISHANFDRHSFINESEWSSNKHQLGRIDRNSFSIVVVCWKSNVDCASGESVIPYRVSVVIGKPMAVSGCSNRKLGLFVEYKMSTSHFSVNILIMCGARGVPCKLHRERARCKLKVILSYATNLIKS